MNLRVCILAMLCVAALATTSTAAPPATAAKKATAADSSAAKSAAVKPATKSAPATKGGIRTIDAINIEGEIVVPQVLFITSRDNRRYRDGLGKNYRLGTLDVARGITVPKRLCVAGSSESFKSESFKEE